jgi:hypothetical protein
MRNLWEFKGCVKIWQKEEIMMKMMRRIGRWKNVEERKTWQIFTYESRYFKNIWQGEKRTKWWKKDKKRTKGWKDDEMMMHSLV